MAPMFVKFVLFSFMVRAPRSAALQLFTGLCVWSFLDDARSGSLVSWVRPSFEALFPAPSC